LLFLFPFSSPMVQALHLKPLVSLLSLDSSVPANYLERQTFIAAFSGHSMKDFTHKILLLLVVLTIVGEFLSIILWATNRPVDGEPFARFSLAVDYRIAVANAAVFVVLNLVALIWILRRNKLGPLFLIAISIINRLISEPIFIGGIHGIFLTWTAVLVIVAYLDYRKLSKIQKPKVF
jgi:hypothetical protein